MFVHHRTIREPLFKRRCPLTTLHSFSDRSRAAEFANTSLGRRVKLDNVATSSDGVDEDVATGESVVAPSAGERNLASADSL